MAHFTGPDVSGRISPAIHAGLNAHTSFYSMEAKTLTGSQSISMQALPRGARVRGATLTTSELLGAGLGKLQVILTTADTQRAQIIQTASAAAVETYLFNPDHSSNLYKTTASSQVRIVLTGTMSASVSTTFALTLLYTTDGDEEGSSSP
jgi:hypothetical protein